MVGLRDTYPYHKGRHGWWGVPLPHGSLVSRVAEQCPLPHGSLVQRELAAIADRGIVCSVFERDGKTAPSNSLI